MGRKGEKGWKEVEEQDGGKWGAILRPIIFYFNLFLFRFFYCYLSFPQFSSPVCAFKQKKHFISPVHRFCVFVYSPFLTFFLYFCLL